MLGGPFFFEGKNTKSNQEYASRLKMIFNRAELRSEARAEIWPNRRQSESRGETRDNKTASSQMGAQSNHWEGLVIEASC